jgi:arylsulfatase A
MISGMQEAKWNRRQFLAGAVTAVSAAASVAADRPLNVVLIYCDDLGYGDLGCYGSKIRTPHIDALAGEGIRFTNFYSANPVCSPSRAALLTARYPTRVGVPRVLFPNSRDGLPQSETTLAQVLKAKGYRTMCVGKWHLGHLPEYLPTRRGFDEYFGIPYSNDMNPRPLLHATQEKTEVVEEQATLETLTPRYTGQAIRFIDGAKGSPFFLYMPHTYPHIPLAASERFRGKSPLGTYGDVVEELDWSVGDVLAALKRNGLVENTLVLFSSDNGPWYQGSPGLLRGRKGMTYEGGVREPFIARLPGRVAKGRVCHGIASTMDLLPTIANLCSATLPKVPLDGIDIWPMLAGEKEEIPREALLYFDDVHLQCARLKQWKIHVARYNSAVYSPAPPGGRRNLPLASPELYNLLEDPSESYDVAPGNPSIVAELLARIDRIMKTFPEHIQKDYADTKAVQTLSTPAGQVPRVF